MKSQFQVILENEIEKLDIEIAKMLVTANATRDFLAGREYHSLLLTKQTVKASLEYALEAYKKGKK